MGTINVIGQTGRRLTARGSDNLPTRASKDARYRTRRRGRRGAELGSPMMKQLGLGEVLEGAQEPA